MTLLRGLTFLLGSQTVIFILLLFWIYFFPLTPVFVQQCLFPPLVTSDHVIVSVSIDFPSNSQWDAPFHRIPYDYSLADRDHLCDHLRDVPWEDIFKLGTSATASEFCEWVQVGIDICISHRKLSPWFSGACAAAIEITFFVCTKRINLLSLN